MLGSLLIANRGEIARRIIRTARRLGVRTIAVYSEADAGAPHVREADEAALIGPAAASESYLRADRILDAARRMAAQAVHPGYGFLSENPAFAEAVIAGGLTWVGPPPQAIRAMGLKDAAKRLMSEAGVPVTPGYLGEDQSEARLMSEAETIGWPVLIKAVAGGGGKGMRLVERPADFEAALAAARREAKASFGDDRVLLERYVGRARHIEVQVFGDAHGQVIHLNERDCSLQRRRQKVIEEAPAPGMDAATRAAVCAAAVKAAQAVGYVGAGTVEFIADAGEGLRPDRVWFMEMNTRLQVEHPVTEAVTGLDLVEWQLRIASGEPLPLRQEQIPLQGHAIEARLYAESPQTGFLPSTGPLTRLRLPEHSVRIDAGVEQGSEVSPFYDPMIAKLIAFAPSRSEAAARLEAACRKVQVWPVKTNAAFLARCLADTEFIAGKVDTGFIDQRLEDLVGPGDPPGPVLAAAAAVRLAAEADRSPWSGLPGFRLNAAAEVRVRLQYGDTVLTTAPGPVDPESAMRMAGVIVVFADGEAYEFGDPRASVGEADQAEDGAVRSPMPGRIVAVHAKAGDPVAKGAALLTLEAMKMEHVMAAPFAGVLAEVGAAVGDQVQEGAVLARLDKPGQAS